MSVTSLENLTKRTSTSRVASFALTCNRMGTGPRGRSKQPLRLQLQPDIELRRCELTCNDLATDWVKLPNRGSQVIDLKRRKWSRGRELNSRPADYESAALPLSYLGFDNKTKNLAKLGKAFERKLYSICT